VGELGERGKGNQYEKTSAINVPNGSKTCRHSIAPDMGDMNGWSFNGPLGEITNFIR
jgi:hypothetical protein